MPSDPTVAKTTLPDEWCEVSRSESTAKCCVVVKNRRGSQVTATSRTMAGALEAAAIEARNLDKLLGHG